MKPILFSGALIAICYFMGVREESILVLVFTFSCLLLIVFRGYTS